MQSPCVSAIVTCSFEPALPGTQSALEWIMLLTAGEILILEDSACASLSKEDGGGISFLLGREIIVTSPLTNGLMNGPFITLIDSVEGALALAGEVGAKEVFVFGGEKLYGTFFPCFSKIHIIGTKGKGTDRLFPKIECEKWKEVGSRQGVVTLERSN